MHAGAAPGAAGAHRARGGRRGRAPGVGPPPGRLVPAARLGCAAVPARPGGLPAPPDQDGAWRREPRTEWEGAWHSTADSDLPGCSRRWRGTSATELPMLTGRCCWGILSQRAAQMAASRKVGQHRQKGFYANAFFVCKSRYLCAVYAAKHGIH